MRASGLLIAIAGLCGGFGLAGLAYNDDAAVAFLIAAVAIGALAASIRRRLRAQAPKFGDVPEDGSLADRTAAIRIDRTAGGLNDRGRGYFVMIDGRLAGLLKGGDALSVPVRPGEHHVQLTIDWCRSRRVSVVAHAGRTTRLTATPRRAVLAFYYASFGYRDYVRLEASPERQMAGLVTPAD